MSAYEIRLIKKVLRAWVLVVAAAVPGYAHMMHSLPGFCGEAGRARVQSNIAMRGGEPYAGDPPALPHRLRVRAP